MRRQALSAWDIIDAAFEDWHVKSWMVWFAEGTVQPAERPGTGTLAYSFVAGRQRNGWAIPRGGSGSLPLALCRIVEAQGGAVAVRSELGVGSVFSAVLPLDSVAVAAHDEAAGRLRRFEVCWFRIVADR